MLLEGKAICYGDNIDTDVIIPARYLTTSDPAVLAQHCMEDIDPGFLSKIQKPAISSPRAATSAAVPRANTRRCAIKTAGVFPAW